MGFSRSAQQVSYTNIHVHAHAHVHAHVHVHVGFSRSAQQVSYTKLLSRRVGVRIRQRRVGRAPHPRAIRRGISCDVIKLSSRVIQSDRTMLSRSLNPYNISMLIERRQHYNTQQLPMSGAEVWRHPDQPPSPIPFRHPIPPKTPEHRRCGGGDRV